MHHPIAYSALEYVGINGGDVVLLLSIVSKFFVESLTSRLPLEIVFF